MSYVNIDENQFINDSKASIQVSISNKKNVYKPQNTSEKMNKWSELLLGLILIIGPILIAFYSWNWGAWNFWSAAGTFFKGGLFWLLVMVGVLFVLLGISDLRENNRSQPVSAQATPPMPAKKGRGN